MSVNLTLEKLNQGISGLMMEKWALEEQLVAAGARIAELEARLAPPAEEAAPSPEPTPIGRAKRRPERSGA